MPNLSTITIFFFWQLCLLVIPSWFCWRCICDQACIVWSGKAGHYTSQRSVTLCVLGRPASPWSTQFLLNALASGPPHAARHARGLRAWWARSSPPWGSRAPRSRERDAAPFSCDFPFQVFPWLAQSKVQSLWTSWLTSRHIAAAMPLKQLLSSDDTRSGLPCWPGQWLK